MSDNKSFDIVNDMAKKHREKMNALERVLREHRRAADERAALEAFMVKMAGGEVQAMGGNTTVDFLTATNPRMGTCGRFLLEYSRYDQMKKDRLNRLLSGLNGLLSGETGDGNG